MARIGTWLQLLKDCYNYAVFSIFFEPRPGDLSLWQPKRRREIDEAMQRIGAGLDEWRSSLTFPNRAVPVRQEAIARDGRGTRPR
jgi:hypothetical protein